MPTGKETMTPKRICLAFGVLAVSAVSMAQTKITYDGRPERLYMPRAAVSIQDSNFLKAAAIANIFEIESSKLAASRANSTFVRQFAKEMVMDHVAAFDELKTVADKNGVDLPGHLPPKLANWINKLRNSQGAAFDRNYKIAQEMGHKDTKAKMQTEVKMGHNEDARDYAVKTLPGVTMHLRMLKMGMTMTGPTKADHNI
jgi:putative membrane protein